LLILSTHLPVFAESAKKRETVLTLPWTHVTQGLLDFSGQSPYQPLLEMELPPQTLTVSDLPVELRGIHVQLFSSVSSLPSDDGEVRWALSPLRAFIQLGTLEISQVVERNINGIVARVHLNAKCTGMEMIQENAQAQVGVTWSGQGMALNGRVSSLDLNWPSDSWKLQPFKCTGLDGFSQIVEQQLNAQLSHPETWAPLIRSRLESHLNQKIQDSLRNFKKPQVLWEEDEVQLHLFLTDLQVDTLRGVVVKGNLDVVDLLENEGKVPEAKDPVELVPMDPDKIKEAFLAESPALLASGEEVSELLRQLVSKRDLHLNLNQVSEFQRLLRSRILQFFVWPDLFHYSKSAVFPSVSRVKSNVQAQFHNQRIYMKGGVNSWVYSKRDGKVWRYLDVLSNFFVGFLPDVSQGKLILKPEQVDLKTDGAMTSDYKARFRPTSRVPFKTINAALKVLPFFKNYEVQVPKIQLNGEMVYQAEKLHHHIPGYYLIEMKRLP
tara:strand:- start:277 stop:1758 length:1482 start_codon:yes stop_codon:yes gene_type:complete